MRDNGRLVRAATGHSRAMVRRRFFAHVGPGSLGLADRLRRARYIPRRGGTWLIGENIGFGRGRFTRPATMHRAWMRSTPHRAAMLERRFREVGFGIVSGRPYGGGGATFTADFGRRAADQGQLAGVERRPQARDPPVALLDAEPQHPAELDALRALDAAEADLQHAVAFALHAEPELLPVGPALGPRLTQAVVAGEGAGLGAGQRHVLRVGRVRVQPRLQVAGVPRGDVAVEER